MRISVLIIGLVLVACNSKPKVIEGEPLSTGQGLSETQAPLESFHGDNAGDHRVVVHDFRHTERYTYLHVTENQDSFWIVIPRREVAPGEQYFYRGGMLTENFHSQEFDETFETVYLVSEVVRLDNNPSSNNEGSEVVKLADLFENPDKYEGKLVKVSGTCIKVNAMIMGKNWVHIEDGSGEKLDLTATTNETVSPGSVVTLEGTIALNKDFGSGYSYDIILEEAVLR